MKDMEEIIIRSGQKGHGVHMENMDYMLTYVENMVDMVYMDDMKNMVRMLNIRTWWTLRIRWPWKSRQIWRTGWT
jgi:hypothetical protein